jgi:hypothetical protein
MVSSFSFFPVIVIPGWTYHIIIEEGSFFLSFVLSSLDLPCSVHGTAMIMVLLEALGWTSTYTCTMVKRPPPKKTFGLLLNIMESPCWVEVHSCDFVMFRPTNARVIEFWVFLSLKFHGHWGCALGIIRKPSTRIGAPRWFHNFQTYSAGVIKFLIIIYCNMCSMMQPTIVPHMPI